MNQTINRRCFIGLGSAVLGGCTSSGYNSASRCSSGDWDRAETIVDTIIQPHFPAKDFHLEAFGAVGDGQHDCSKAFHRAVEACHKQGGGRVVVAPGNYLTGPIHLLSNVNLHLQSGALLTFYTDPSRFLPAVFTRWEGMELMGYSPLIYAFRQHNIAVTGPGVLDGQASRDNWWAWKGGSDWGRLGSGTQQKGRQRLMADVEAMVPVHSRNYGEGFYFRPPFIQLYQCSQVLLEDVHIKRSPFWLVNPVLCDNVTVRGLHLQSLGPNSDGCNPESCRNVLIEQCFFDTGDDCIAIKSGRNADGRRIGVASENIVIRNCLMRAGHGGVVIGSEISGGANSIFVENCIMSSPDLERGIRIKTNSIRGGLIENLYFRNLVMGEVRDAIVINFYYEEGDAGDFNPTVRNIRVENVLCQNAKSVFQIRGFDDAPIRNLQLRNCHFLKAESVGIIENAIGTEFSGVSLNGVPLEGVTSVDQA